MVIRCIWQQLKVRILWGPRVWRNAYFFPFQQFWPLGCLCLFILLLFWRGVLHFPYFSLFNRRSRFVLVLIGGSRIGDSWNKHLQESYEVIIFCRMVCVLVAVYFVSRFYTFCFIFLFAMFYYLILYVLNWFFRSSLTWFERKFLFKREIQFSENYVDAIIVNNAWV